MTRHEIINANSNNLTDITDNSINLIITSPPYPMIAMWDDLFCGQNKNIQNYLERGQGNATFLEMHKILDATWRECDRVLKAGGFVCINIGDAVRTINGNFQLYPNRNMVINCFNALGYTILPDILWRKPSNSPAKFMGSGMHPAGAYVTYEHEYILIFRKGNKRQFSAEEKLLRKKSAYFWEERNVWFSDLWEILGASQNIGKRFSRNRNASFPFAIPYRLINMYSIESDWVLDPFCGFGITNQAALVANRNSIGCEIDNGIAGKAIENLCIDPELGNKIIDARIAKHQGFIESLSADKIKKCYENKPYGFLVKTRQEMALKLDRISGVKQNNNIIECTYE